jgi:hypothetical protein
MMPEEAVDDSSHLPDNAVQQQPHQVSDFLLDLKEKNAFIAFQALLDSIDLWNSCIKYYCDVLNPTSSRASAQMMIDILNTPGGAALFFVGSALFGAFAFLGNYADAKDIQNSTISRIADAYWPYVRDCIKGVKWTYKGMRSVFLVGQIIYAELSIALIVPLGVGLGVLSAVNRFWNRSMVERRKLVQNANNDFREHIKCINACYMALDELPSEWQLQHIYPGSVLKINEQYFQVSEHGKCEALDHLSSEELQVLDSNRGQETGGRIDWFHFKTLLADNNIPENSVLSRLCLEKKNFLKEIANQKHAQNANAGLICFNQWPSKADLRSVYQGCVVARNGDYLVIDAEGIESQLVLSEKEKAFLDTQLPLKSIHDLIEALKQSDLPQESSLYGVFQKRKTLSEWCSRYNDIVGRPQFQKDAFQAKCSAVLSGVLNAPYYFLGILSMVALPYAAFIGAVAACSTFMVLNVVAELYLESEYQRRLKVTELKARMSMLKRLMSSELDLINDSLTDISARTSLELNQIPQDAKENYTQALKSILERIAPDKKLSLLSDFLNTVKDANLTHLSPDEQALIQHLQNRAAYQKDFLETKKLLHDELVLNDQYLVMQGIRNGLYCYGIANGFLMTLAIMSFFGIFSFTPALFWASIGFGFFCLAAGVAYTVLFSNELCELDATNKFDLKALEQDEDLVDEQQNVILNEPPEGGITAEDARLATTMYYVDPVSNESINKTADDIKQTRNLMISDQSEVARQFISGNKKGFKILQTLSVFLPALAANSTSGATQLVYIGVGLTYGFFFSLKGLRNLVRVDNKDYENSSLWKMLTWWDAVEPVLIKKPTPSVNSFFTYLRKSNSNFQQPVSDNERTAGYIN